MDWTRQQVFVDAMGKVAAGAGPELVARVIWLPAATQVVGKTYLELHEIPRKAGKTADFHVRHYLPGYAAKLTSDLEVALGQGQNVYLWEMPRTLLLFGHGALVPEGYPWSDGQSWYQSAQDALKKHNPRPAS